VRGIYENLLFRGISSLFFFHLMVVLNALVNLFSWGKNYVARIRIRVSVSEGYGYADTPMSQKTRYADTFNILKNKIKRNNAGLNLKLIAIKPHN